MSAHKQRAHSKFSASGSERWLKCAASVELEEASPPSEDSVWSVEGTKAHEVHETVFKVMTNPAFDMPGPCSVRTALSKSNNAMVAHAKASVDIILGIADGLADPEILIEQRIHNGDIHPEMFGTVDAALVELYGTLHVIDYKYGEGHIVNPVENTQMIQYALGFAAKYDYQFTDVEMHIIQPRGGGKIHKRWKITIEELRDKWRPLWVKGVERVTAGKSKPFPGSHCYWCRASKPVNGVVVCTAKRDQIKEVRNEKILNKFDTPFNEGISNNGEKQEVSKKDIKPQSQKSAGKKAVEAFSESEDGESWF